MIFYRKRMAILGKKKVLQNDERERIDSSGINE